MANKVAAAIFAARRATWLTQRQLGARIGVKAGGIGRWERGQATPSKRNQRALVAAIRERSASAGAQLEAALNAGQDPPSAAAAPAPITPPPPDPSTVLQLAVFRMADELDLPPRRLRGPLLRLLKQLQGAGIGIEEAIARIDRWAREVE